MNEREITVSVSSLLAIAAATAFLVLLWQLRGLLVLLMVAIVLALFHCPTGGRCRKRPRSPLAVRHSGLSGGDRHSSGGLLPHWSHRLRPNPATGPSITLVTEIIASLWRNVSVLKMLPN